LFMARRFRFMETDFGIVPMPKLNELQETYRTPMSTATSVFGIPITSRDPERTALIMEALTAVSQDIIKPAFYENIIYVKSIRDEESLDMLENYIIPNKTYDLGLIFELGGSTGYSRSVASSLPTKNASSLSVYFERSRDSTQTAIDKMIAEISN